MQVEVKAARKPPTKAAAPSKGKETTATKPASTKKEAPAKSRATVSKKTAAVVQTPEDDEEEEEDEEIPVQHQVNLSHSIKSSLKRRFIKKNLH